MLAIGYVSYLLGKLLFAGLSARVGGLPLVALTSFGTVAFTLVLTTCNSFPTVALVWTLLRGVQSCTWPVQDSEAVHGP